MKKKEHSHDLELVSRVRKGDTYAYRQLVEKYKDISFSLACSILKNEHDAEDVLQEAFIKVYKGIARFNQNASLATWLYRIVVNTCYTQMCKKQRQWEYNEEEIQKHELSDEGTGLDKLLLDDRTTMINSVLDKLKPDETLLLRLYYLSELDTAEVREVTGFSESKVKTTLFRARKSFLAMYKKMFGNELSFTQ